jgi:anti-sigma28 factor (negative regulator of flagellin synthesis)
MTTVLPPDIGKVNIPKSRDNPRVATGNVPGNLPMEPELNRPVKDLAISDAVAQAIKSADFDESKVREISEAIRQGNYPLDARKIAESFVPLEKLL